MLKFVDSNFSYDESRFVILGAPYDRTCDFRRGSREGPNAIRRASYNIESYVPEYDVSISRMKICDLGNMEISERFLDELYERTRKIASDGKLPILLGGEHTISYSGVKACDPDRVVVLDAHLDLRDEYLGNRFSHACVSRRICDLVGPENLVIVGARTGSEEDYEFAERNGIRFCGFSEAVEGERIYLSLDMDVIDPAYAPAVSTPEPFGAEPKAVRKFIASIAPRVIGFDVVEVAPMYDCGQTSMIAAKLIIEFIAAKGRYERV